MVAAAPARQGAQPVLRDDRRRQSPIARYEALKSRLPADLTPAEYEAAVRRITRECGL